MFDPEPEPDLEEARMAAQSAHEERDVMNEPLFEGHTRVIDTTTRHHIVWEFDSDMVRAKAVCESGPDANCRQEAICDCEAWNIERDDTGAVYHLAWGEDELTEDEVEVRHPMRAGKDCNVCVWLNEGDIEELAVEVTQFVIAKTPILGHWEDDHVTWSPTGPATGHGSIA